MYMTWINRNFQLLPPTDMKPQPMLSRRLRASGEQRYVVCLRCDLQIIFRIINFLRSATNSLPANTSWAGVFNPGRAGNVSEELESSCWLSIYSQYTMSWLKPRVLMKLGQQRRCLCLQLSASQMMESWFKYLYICI